jgi:tetratricopeptide (TPR) repeat protein
MNERFIPLKIDAEREATLAQSLQIQSYPTIVMAAADGKILETIVGYKDAPAFHEILQKVLGTTSDPDWMTRDIREAGKAATSGDNARAVALLKAITEDGKDRPVQQKARQALQELEKQAAGRLVKARALDEKGQTAEAIQALTEVSKGFAGTQGAAEATQLASSIAGRPDVKSQQRTKRAKELLAQARDDYRTQQYLCCLDRCEVLAASYADLPEGGEAMQIASEIKGNPEWMRQACDNLSDRLGMLYLSLAETWLRKGQPQQAVTYLERVIQTFPGTRQAEAAQIRLAFIRGQASTQTTDVKKP